jgi:hypothetical protein
MPGSGLRTSFQAVTERIFVLLILQPDHRLELFFINQAVDVTATLGHWWSLTENPMAEILKDHQTRG